MACDEGPVQRIREAREERPGIAGRRSFGGLAFRVGGRMSVGVVGDERIGRVGDGRARRGAATAAREAGRERARCGREAAPQVGAGCRNAGGTLAAFRTAQSAVQCTIDLVRLRFHLDLAATLAIGCAHARAALARFGGRGAEGFVAIACGLRSSAFGVPLALTLGCGASQPVEVSRCSPPEVAPLADEECRATPEARAYADEMATALARASGGTGLDGLALGVEVGGDGSPRSVCAAPEAGALPWRARRALARANASLGSLPRAPACLAGARLDLTEAVAKASASLRTRAQAALGSCLSIRDHLCLEQDAPVCGVFPDGTRRSYRNACEACRNPSLTGWLEGACSLR